LRLGYVVVPADVAEAFAAARSVTDRQPPGVDQAILARFMAEGHFARHVRRMRELYAERQDVLVAALRKHLRGLIDVERRPAGMHVIGFLPAGVDDVEVARRAQARGVDAVALSAYYVEAQPRSGLLLGFTADPPDAIREAVRRLREILMRV
jgi:GntR family transcriptional regulator / MocR family aminotransferase